MNKKLKYLLLPVVAVVFYSCNDLQEPNIVGTPDTDAEIITLLNDFYHKSYPNSRSSARLFVTSVSSKSYSSDGKIEIMPSNLSRGMNDDETFDILTVSFETNGQDGLALVLDKGTDRKILFFSDNACISDTADIAPLKYIFDEAPIIGASDYSHIPDSLPLMPPGSEPFDTININFVRNITRNVWAQCMPYNMFAPERTVPTTNRHYGGRMPIGCGAVALGQLFATVGVYDNDNYNNLLLHNMEYPTTHADSLAVGTFLYDIATRINTYFTNDASYSNLYRLKSLMNVVGFETELMSDFRENFVYTELMRGVPHLVEGATPEGDGHFWLITGFECYNSHQQHYYHCNWGWGGTGNGWVSGNYYTPNTENSTGFPNRLRHIYTFNNPATQGPILEL